MAVEVTTADKIHASLQVLTNSQLYLSMGLLLLLFWIFASMKKTARSMPTMAARFGLMVHWASLLIAAILAVAACLVLSEAQRVNDFTLLLSGGLGLSALVIWLLGKAVRYILAGTTQEPAKISRPAIPARGTSLPPTVPHQTKVGPWGARQG